MLPTPNELPNYQGCQTPLARAQPYCNSSLSVASRVDRLIASLTLKEKVSRMYSCVDNWSVAWYDQATVP